MLKDVTMDMTAGCCSSLHVSNRHFWKIVVDDDSWDESGRIKKGTRLGIQEGGRFKRKNVERIAAGMWLLRGIVSS